MVGIGPSEKLVVLWALLSYSAVIAKALQLLDPGGNTSTVLLAVVGSMLAQIWSSLLLALAKCWLDSSVHIPHCRAFQACYVFMVWTSQFSISAGTLAAIITYCACPGLLLWLPIRKRSAACMVDDQRALPVPDAKPLWFTHRHVGYAFANRFGCAAK